MRRNRTGILFHGQRAPFVPAVAKGYGATQLTGRPDNLFAS